MKSTLRLILILLALTLFFSGTTLLWANPPVTSSFQAGALLAQASEEPEEEDTEPDEEDEDDEELQKVLKLSLQGYEVEEEDLYGAPSAIPRR